MTEKNPKKEDNEYSIEARIEQLIENKLTKLTKSDVKAFVSEIMPDIDQMIANKIKEHFYQIGNFLAEKFKGPGE